MSKSEKTLRKTPKPYRRSVSKSTTKPVQDSVIADIEKFMYECENMQPSPLLVNKGKIYDTDVDLLNVLDSDNKRSAIVNSTSNPTITMPLKKRKSNGKLEEPFKKNVKKDNTISKKPEVVVRPREKQKKKYIQEARIKQYVPPIYGQCKVLRIIKRKCSISYHQGEELHTATCASIKVYTDSQICKILKVKQEVVDLTYDEEQIFLRLNFARSNEIFVEEESVGSLQTLHSPVKVATSTHDYHVVTVIKPEVCFAIDKSCIDLTKVDGCEETNFSITSEKECAYKILNYIYKYYKVHEASEKVRDVLREVEDYFSPKELEGDYNNPAMFFKNRFASIGSEMIDQLSLMLVKNLNLDRFLETIVLKLDQNYNMAVKASSVCLALYVMLNLNRETCSNSLAKELLKQTELYVAKVQMKEEHGDSFENYCKDCGSQLVIMTEEQKMILREQIETYIELADKQEKLLAQLSILDHGAELKSEIEFEEIPVKKENSVIVID